MVKLKRAYEPPARGDGYRVLVERLWPRGVRKEELRLDAWAKDLSPSPELRAWYAHDVERWAEFQKRYLAELKRGPAAEALRALAGQAAAGEVTLVFAARDPEHSSAAVLQGALAKLKAPRRTGRGGRSRPARTARRR